MLKIVNYLIEMFLNINKLNIFEVFAFRLNEARLVKQINKHS